MNKMSKIAVQLCVVFSLSLVQAASYQKKQATFNDCEVSWSLKQSVASQANELANDSYKIYALSVHNKSDHPIYLNPAGYFDNAFNAYISRKNLKNAMMELNSRLVRASKPLLWSCGMSALFVISLIGLFFLKRGKVTNDQNCSWKESVALIYAVVMSLGCFGSIMVTFPWSCARLYRAKILEDFMLLFHAAKELGNWTCASEYTPVDGYIEIKPGASFEDLILVDVVSAKPDLISDLVYLVVV